jgi:hypothetical protein
MYKKDIKYNMELSKSNHHNSEHQIEVRSEKKQKYFNEIDMQDNDCDMTTKKIEIWKNKIKMLLPKGQP